MKRLTKAFAALGVAAGAIISSTPAQAQSATVEASIEVIRTLQLFNDRSLQFGRVVPGAVVTIDPTAAGTRTANSLMLLASSVTSSGIVRAVGEPQTGVTFTIITPAQLVSGSNSLNNLTFTNDLPAVPVLDNPGGGADGSLIVHFGGTVTVGNTAPPGIYRGYIIVQAAYS